MKAAPEPTEDVTPPVSQRRRRAGQAAGIAGAALRGAARILRLLAALATRAADWLRQWSAEIAYQAALDDDADDLFDRWEAAQDDAPKPPLRSVAGRSLLGEWRDV